MCQIEKKDKGSPPATGLELVGEKEKNAKGNRQKNPENREIVTVEVPGKEQKRPEVIGTTDRRNEVSLRMERVEGNPIDNEEKRRKKDIEHSNDRIGLTKDEDAENPEDRLIREEKSSEPSKREEVKTPKEYVKKLSRQEARPRLDLAGHAPKAGKRQKEEREEQRTRGAMVEKNDPPDKTRQNHGKSDESHEEPQDNTSQGERNLDSLREGPDKRSAKTSTKKQPKALKQATTTIGGEDIRKETADRDETVGEPAEKVEKRNVRFQKKINGQGRNEDPQKETSGEKWQSDPPIWGVDGTKTKVGNEGISLAHGRKDYKKEPPDDDNPRESSTRKGAKRGDDTRIQSGKPEQSHRRRGRKTHHRRSGGRA